MPIESTISVSLPEDVVGTVEEAVSTGEYANASEVIREALTEWRLRRQAGVDRETLVALIREGVESGPGVDADAVFDRLRDKYRVMAKG